MSRGDWVVVAGFVALLIGTSLSWHALVETYSEGTMRYGVSGWTSTAGWLSWLASLAAVVVVLSSGVIPPSVRRAARRSVRGTPVSTLSVALTVLSVSGGDRHGGARRGVGPG